MYWSIRIKIVKNKEYVSNIQINICNLPIWDLRTHPSLQHSFNPCVPTSFVSDFAVYEWNKKASFHLRGSGVVLLCVCVICGVHLLMFFPGPLGWTPVSAGDVRERTWGQAVPQPECRHHALLGEGAHQKDAVGRVTFFLGTSGKRHTDTK